MGTASEPTIGVLALQGDAREHAGALDACGARSVPVRRPNELRGLNGLVVPGGESTTMGRLAASLDLLDPLRSAVAGGLPVYGSCAGMIMLADKLVDSSAGQSTIGGIDMVVRRNAFGSQVASFETDLDIDRIGEEPLHAVFIRAPWVEAVGDTVEVLARVTGGRAAGRIVAVRSGNLLATAFHPELTGDRRVHRLFLGMVRAAAGVPDHASQMD